MLRDSRLAVIDSLLLTGSSGLPGSQRARSPRYGRTTALIPPQGGGGSVARGMPPGKSGQYVAPMRRLPPAPASLVDVGVAVLLVAMTAVACWVSPDPIGTPVAGPAWLLAVFPVLFAGPLAWRRQLTHSARSSSRSLPSPGSRS